MTTYLVATKTQAALTALEQTRGEWDLKIRATRRYLRDEPIAQALFPTTSLTKTKFKGRLSLFPNGNFTFLVDGDNGMPIHGRWELGRNPYCPTDRFYDDLLLESYPRVQKRSNDDQVVQRVNFQMKCRIYGRYWGCERSRARISHGVLLTNNLLLEDVPKTLIGWWKRSIVCASFEGRPRLEIVSE